MKNVVHFGRRAAGRDYSNVLSGRGTEVESCHQAASSLSIGPDHNFTCLVPDLSCGVDPDDSFSTVPYEKGASLLW